MARVKQLEWVLRLAVASAFVGHGAYGAVLAKPAWFGYFGVLGISHTGVEAGALMLLVGGFEIVLGVLAVVVPWPPLLVFMAVWKVGSELLRIPAGEPFWEFVERAANMVAPLALLFVMQLRRGQRVREGSW